MDIKKAVLAVIATGAAVGVLGFGIDFLVRLVFPYDVFSLPGVRAADDPVMMLFFASYWVLALALVVVYHHLGSALKGSTVEKGVKFGLLMWLPASLLSIFIVYTSMTYPIGFTISGIVGSLIYMPVAGIIIAKLMD